MAQFEQCHPRNLKAPAPNLVVIQRLYVDAVSGDKLVDDLGTIRFDTISDTSPSGFGDVFIYFTGPFVDIASDIQEFARRLLSLNGTMIKSCLY